MSFSAKTLVILTVACTAVLGWEGTIVFEDNFDGGSLDLGKWEYQEGCGGGKCIISAWILIDS